MGIDKVLRDLLACDKERQKDPLRNCMSMNFHQALLERNLTPRFIISCTRWTTSHWN